MNQKEMNRQQILQIPEQSKTMSVGEMATFHNVTERTIVKWIARLRAEGYEVETRKGPQIKLK